MKKFLTMVGLIAFVCSASAQEKVTLKSFFSLRPMTAQEKSRIDAGFAMGGSKLAVVKDPNYYSYSSNGKTTEIKSRQTIVTAWREFDPNTGLIADKSQAYTYTNTVKYTNYVYTPTDYYSRPERHLGKNYQPPSTVYGPRSPFTGRAPSGGFVGSGMGGTYSVGGGYTVR